MRGEYRSVYGLHASRRQMETGSRPVAVFRAEPTAIGAEFLDDRRSRAHPDVELFQSVVVDRVELDVFVTAAFAGLCVRLAQKVELGS